MNKKDLFTKLTIPVNIDNPKGKNSVYKDNNNFPFIGH